MRLNNLVVECSEVQRDLEAGENDGSELNINEDLLV